MWVNLAGGTCIKGTGFVKPALLPILSLYLLKTCFVLLLPSLLLAASTYRAQWSLTFCIYKPKALQPRGLAHQKALVFIIMWPDEAGPSLPLLFRCLGSLMCLYLGGAVPWVGSSLMLHIPVCSCCWLSHRYLVVLHLTSLMCSGLGFRTSRREVIRS